MALSDFLSELLTPNNISNIASGVLGLNTARNASSNLSSAYAPNAYDTQYQQLANQLAQLTGEMIDPNSPGFQSRVQARQTEIMRQYEQAMRQQQALEARRYGRTGMGIINPERRDEALSRSLASFKSQAEAQARNEALQEMIAAAGTGKAAAGVTGTGLANERARQVAGANVSNAYDQAKKSNYLQLGQAILGPLLKGVDFGKLVGAVTGSQQSTPSGGLPKFDAQDANGLFDPGYGYSLNQPVGMSTPSVPSFSSGNFDFGGFPSFGGDASGMMDPGYGYAGGQNMDFPTFGGDVGGTFDPGYGYDLPNFDMPNFDFPTFGGDVGSFFDPGYGY